MVDTLRKVLGCGPLWTYTVLGVVVTVVCVPVQLWLDRGTPLPEDIADAAYYGQIAATSAAIGVVMQKRRDRRRDRRGAILALAVTVPFLGALTAMTLITGLMVHAGLFSGALLLVGLFATLVLVRGRLPPAAPS